jgi:hypothetical protein
MAVGPIRKQLLWNLMLLIMTGRVPLKIKGEVTDN